MLWLVQIFRYLLLDTKTCFLTIMNSPLAKFQDNVSKKLQKSQCSYFSRWSVHPSSKCLCSYFVLFAKKRTNYELWNMKYELAITIWYDKAKAGLPCGTRLLPDCCWRDKRCWGVSQSFTHFSREKWLQWGSDMNVEKQMLILRGLKFFQTSKAKSKSERISTKMIK